MSIPVTIDPLGTLGAGEPLPPGYTRVKCLVSNGHQMIDTGIVPTFDMRWELDYMYLGLAMGSSARHGCSQSSTSVGVARFELSPRNSTQDVFGGQNKPDVNDSTVSSLQRETSVIDNVAGEFRVGGQTISSAPAGVLPSTSIGLFGRHSSYAPNINYDLTFSCKVYRSRIFKSGALVQDLVPCLDDNGTACMSDLVGGETYRAVKPTAYDLQPFGYEL